MRSAKNGYFELPVVVIRKHSAWMQLKHSWCSTIKVAVKCVEQNAIHRRGEGKSQLRKKIALDTRDMGLCAGALLLSPLLEDELYAKDLIEINEGVVEIGSGWPSGDAKPIRLQIVWLDMLALFDIDGTCKGQETALPLTLLMGHRFVDAFNVYQQQHRLLMSSSALPLHVQRVAHELRVLLVHILKNLHNNRHLFDNPTQGPIEELLLISIMNILVDLQLSDEKNATRHDTSPLLSSDGDVTASDDCLRIIKHKVLSDAIVTLQSVLALKSPLKKSIHYTRLDELEKEKEGARGRVFYMQRAVFDIIELLKYRWQTVEVHAETHTLKGVSSALFKAEEHNGGVVRESRLEYVHEKLAEVEWKMLLAVLGIKDPASFENVLCSIHDEKQRWLVEMMAGPLGFVENTGSEKLSEETEPLTRGASSNTESSLQVNMAAEQTHKMGEREKKVGAVGADYDTSCGYYVKADIKLLGHQMRGNSNQILQSESAVQGGAHASNVSFEPDHICEPNSSKNLEGKCTTPVQENASQFSRLQGQGWKVVELLQEHADLRCALEQGVEWQSEDPKYLCTNDQARTTDQVAKPFVDSSLDDAGPPQVDINSHVMDEGGAAAASRSQPTFHDESDPVVELPLQQQAALDSCNTDRAANHLGAAIGLGIVDQAALRAISDLHIPDHASTHVTSSSQAIAYTGDEDEDGGDNDDHYEDVKVSKARHRRRRNLKPHRVRENQEPQCISHCQMGRSRSSARKISLGAIIVFLLLATIVGTIWFHAVILHLENKQCRAFAKGYLP